LLVRAGCVQGRIDVKGDVVVIEQYHRRAARDVVRAIAARIAANRSRFVITVAGESGSGKSETAAAIAEELTGIGFRAVVLGQDDYFVLPPKSTDMRRREDPEWLGPHCEVDFQRLQGNVDDAIAGAMLIMKPLVDYDADSAVLERVDLDGVKVVVVEGTYTSLLRHVEVRVFIARNRLETLGHRLTRNRGSEALDPFIEGVLDVEHKIIAGHRYLADFIVTNDYDVLQVR
jgi:uridine kinase